MIESAVGLPDSLTFQEGMTLAQSAADGAGEDDRTVIVMTISDDHATAGHLSLDFSKGMIPIYDVHSITINPNLVAYMLNRKNLGMVNDRGATFSHDPGAFRRIHAPFMKSRGAVRSDITFVMQGSVTAAQLEQFQKKSMVHVGGLKCANGFDDDFRVLELVQPRCYVHTRGFFFPEQNFYCQFLCAVYTRGFFFSEQKVCFFVNFCQFLCTMYTRGFFSSTSKHQYLLVGRISLTWCFNCVQ